jgi:plastocyanin
MRPILFLKLSLISSLALLVGLAETAQGQSRMSSERRQDAPIVVEPPIFYPMPIYYPSPMYNYPSYGHRDSTVHVGAYDNYFSPQPITIRPGMTVEWTNYGKHKHTVTSDDRQWDSGDMMPNTVYSWTFPVAGVYHCHCAHHKGMSGTIIVQESSRGNGSGRSSGY